MSLSDLFFPELTVSRFSSLDELYQFHYHRHSRHLQNNQQHHRDRHPPAFSPRATSLLADPLVNARGLRRRMQRSRTPAVETKEDELGRCYLVEVELPGVKRENVDVRIGEDGRRLIVEGKVARRVGKARPEQGYADKMDEDARRPAEENIAFGNNALTPSPSSDDSNPINETTTPPTDQEPPQQQVTSRTRLTSDEQ